MRWKLTNINMTISEAEVSYKKQKEIYIIFKAMSRYFD